MQVPASATSVRPWLALEIVRVVNINTNRKKVRPSEQNRRERPFVLRLCYFVGTARSEEVPGRGRTRFCQSSVSALIGSVPGSQALQKHDPSKASARRRKRYGRRGGQKEPRTAKD